MSLIRFGWRFVLTLLFLFVFRLCVLTPAPGVAIASFSRIAGSLGSEGGFSSISHLVSSNSYSLGSLGLMPIILSSVLLYLFASQGSSKSELSDNQGLYFRISRGLLLGITVVYAVFTAFLGGGKLHVLHEGASLAVLLYTSSIVTGVMIAAWVGESITEYLIGSGTSLLILSNIAQDIAGGMINGVGAGGGSHLSAVISIVFAAGLFMIVVFFELSYLKLPVTTKPCGGTEVSRRSNFLPVKLNMSGVMPLIFSSSLLGLMLLAVRALPSDMLDSSSSFGGIVAFVMKGGSLMSAAFYLVTLLVFTRLYSQIVLDPVKTADNLKRGGFILASRRPGSETANFILSAENSLSFLATLYLFTVVFCYDFLKDLSGSTVAVSGSSFLVAIVIANELLGKLSMEWTALQYRRDHFFKLAA